MSDFAYWNHRVMRHVDDGEEWFAIHEVHYDDDGTPHSWTEQPTSVSSTDGIDGIEWALEGMLKCLKKPVLEYE